MREISNSRIRVVVSLVFFAISACTSKIETQISDLAKARNCWALTRTKDYSFDLQTKCFGACFGPVSVEVALGDIVSVTPHEGATSYRDEYLEYVPKIGDLFDRVLHYIERSSEDGVDLDVTFDPTYGYPQTIIFKDTNSSDGFFEAIVENVDMKQTSPATHYNCRL